jgi:hypothetical protein
MIRSFIITLSAIAVLFLGIEAKEKYDVHAFTQAYGQAQGLSPNSTETPLDAGQTFTGPWQPTYGQYANLAMIASTDCEATLQFSEDKINVDGSLPPYQVAAGINEVHVLRSMRSFYRLVITNTSSTNQNYLRAYTSLGSPGNLTAPSNLTIGQDADATIARQISEEFDIALGRRAGLILIQKFGKNSDIDTGSVPEDIWAVGGVYTGFVSQREKVEIVSSSAEDSAAGTGCRSVFVSGLDSDFNIQTENVVPAGITPVDTVGTYSRVNRLRCDEAGSSSSNVGLITARHTTTTANVFGTIIATAGQSEIGCYTVPAGYTGHLKQFRYSMFDSNTNRSTVEFFIKNENGSELRIRPQSVSTSNDLSISPYGSYVFSEKTDLCGRVISIANNNGNMNFSFEMILVKN